MPLYVELHSTNNVKYIGTACAGVSNKKEF